MKIRRLALSGVVAALVGATIVSVSGVVAAEAAQYPMSAKQIIFGGKLISQPMGIAAVDPSSGSNTTYMPIWYVMQALKSIGVQSGWDGSHWTMTMPSNLSPSVNLSSIHAGSGAKMIYINNVNVQNMSGIVYPDPASHVNTTYIPIWYVMKVLGYENIQSGWDGNKWAMTPPEQSTSGDVDFQMPSSGVTTGVTNTGNSTESWQDNGQDVLLNSVNYTSGSNFLPIQGKVNGSSRSGVVVEVYRADDENWFYSIPVDSTGAFSATIELPYTGSDCVSVGIPQLRDTFGLSNSATYVYAQNNQPSCTDQQMALLQSWMVNYNGSDAIATLAKSIAANTTTKDGLIEAVSDWVSGNTEYNFPEVNANNTAWQQATQTLQSKIGVCQDQAALSAALLRSLGVPTEVIGGEAYDPGNNYQDMGPHAWNMAWDGSRWILFDSTWDQSYSQDQRIAPPDSIDHTYFDIPLQTFEKSHKPDATQAFGWVVLAR
jgi:hypothetical protein